MYTDEEGKLAVKIARATIEAHLASKTSGRLELPPSFRNKAGVFVTLNTHPEGELRGCIGFPEPTYPLAEALPKAAVEAATDDPRFPKVKLSEMDKIAVEVSLLTPPELIHVGKPKEYVEKVKIGRDGLIVQQGWHRGLLLPQVPVEWKWGVEEFLGHTCMKAGLTPDEWLDPRTKFYSFQAEVFHETKPRGEVVRFDMEAEVATQRLKDEG